MASINPNIFVDLCEELELSKKQCNLLGKRLPKVCKGTRKKRAPSKYNIYMGQCVPQKKNSMSIPEAFKACAQNWKVEKKKNG